MAQSKVTITDVETFAVYVNEAMQLPQSTANPDPVDGNGYCYKLSAIQTEIAMIIGSISSDIKEIQSDVANYSRKFSSHWN